MNVDPVIYTPSANPTISTDVTPITSLLAEPFTSFTSEQVAVDPISHPFVSTLQP